MWDRKRTQPELANGTLLGSGFLADGFGLSTLGLLFLCKGLIGTALLGCLDLFGLLLARVLCLLVLGAFTIVRCVYVGVAESREENLIMVEDQGNSMSN